MSPETVMAVRALGWTLLHSIWQGAVIASGIKILLPLIPVRAAKARHHIAFAGFLFLFAWFVSTGIHQWQLSQIQPVTITENTPAGPAVKTYQLSNETSVSYTDKLLKPLIPQSDVAFNIIAAMYIAGLLLMLVRMGKSLLYTRRLRNSGITPEDKSWQEHIEQLREYFMLEIPVTLQFSKMTDVPVIMGVLKPVILLPFTITSQLSQDQLEAILLHELAHIKRQDYLTNIIQSIIETLLFFNPFMWIISAEIRREREHCCDDLVISCTENPLQYAHALAALEAGRSETLSLGLAATGKRHNLFNRIKRIMEMKTENYHYGKLAAALLIVCGLGISALWLNPSFAQGKKNKDDKTKVWVSDEKLTVTDEYGKQHVYPTLEQWPEKERQRMVKEYTHNGMVMFFGPQNKQIVIDPQTGKTNITVAGKYAFAHPAEAPEPPVIPEPAVAAPPPAPEDIAAAAPVPSMPAEDGDNDSNDDGNNDEGTPGKNIETDVDNIVSNALSAVNWDSIGNTVNIALKEVQTNVDWKKVNREIQKGFEEAGKAMNDPKVREEMRRAMAEAKKAMAEARVQSQKQICIARDQSRKQMDEAREQTRKAMAEARISMQVVRDEAATNRRKAIEMHVKDNQERNAAMDYDNMLNQMDRQGLIDRDKKFKIETIDGRLYINGNEQSSSTYNQYSRYLNHNKVRIKGNKGQLNISVSDSDTHED
ncbi:M56 family metallopeptidase [Chitinophagaceae bacterium MMS25-I14]